jgi:hypothetical protein
MGTTQAHISGQGSSTVEEVARQKTFHLKQRTNKHGEVVTRGDGKTHQATLASAVVGVQNWPTANARDWKDSGPTQGNRQNPNLGTAVVKDAANWLTPQSGDVTGSTREAVVMWASGQRPKTSDQRLRTQVAAEQLKHGQAAPASSNSLGSRQGLWPTARGLDGQLSESLDTWEARRARKEAQGINLHRPLPIAVEQEQRKQWATPRNCGGPDFAKTTRPTSTSNSPSLPTQVAMQGWITPKASDGKSPGISRDIHLNHQAGGKLNPRWVETLMGLPIGWTMPSCTSPQTIAPMSCDSSAMELCQPPQSELSEFSLAS